MLTPAHPPPPAPIPTHAGCHNQGLQSLLWQPLELWALILSRHQSLLQILKMAGAGA